jgi:hypothetical protein
MAEVGIKSEVAIEVSTKIVNSIEDRLKAENLTDSDIKDTNLEELKTLLGYLARFQDIAL